MTTARALDLRAADTRRSPDPRRADPSGLREALARATAEVEHLSTYDALTGCLTPAGLARVLAAWSGPGAAIAVACDDLVRVCDALGQATGDVVLRAVAERMRGITGSAPLGRVGDRFVVLLAETGPAEARVLAERVRLSVDAEPFVWEPAPVHVAARVSLATIERGDTSVDDLLGRARPVLRDTAVEPDMPVSRVAHEGYVVRTAARTGDGLAFVAQSLRAIPSERVVGWEMLARGPGPVARPDHLFRLAGDLEVVAQLDRMCARLAAEAARSAGLDGRVHVNLRPATLAETPVDRLLGLLGAPPGAASWCVELSERGFVDDPGALLDRRRALRDGGVILAIDDVGSCRGTLDSVLVLEPEVAKLDVRVVRGLAGDERRRRFVRRLVAMGRALGAEIVAEGVENREDLAVLLDLGVTTAQGWLWDGETR